MRRASSQSTQYGRPGAKQGTVAGMRHQIDSFDCLELPQESHFKAKTTNRQRGAISGFRRRLMRRNATVFGEPMRQATFSSLSSPDRAAAKSMEATPSL